jgi:hypothetical protein
MEVSTWDGFPDADEQDDPAATQSLLFNPDNNAPPSKKRNEAEMIPGILCASLPLMMTPGMAAKAISKPEQRSLNEPCLEVSAKHHPKASDMPTIPGTLSVPLRRPLSWPPPTNKGLIPATFPELL